MKGTLHFLKHFYFEIVLERKIKLQNLNHLRVSCQLPAYHPWIEHAFPTKDIFYVTKKKNHEIKK